MLSDEINWIAKAMEEASTTGMSAESAAFFVGHLRKLAADTVNLERTLKFKRTVDRVAPPPLKLPANAVRLSFVR